MIIEQIENKHNTFGKGEEERAVNGGLDKYYTKDYIAEYYSKVVMDKFGNKGVKYIEPSAGAGAFLIDAFEDIKGFDLAPERSDITQQNIFEASYKKDNIIIGNPPFGMAGSLAVKIFNHISKSKVKAMCFILPKTFKKDSIINKLDKNYKLTFQDEVIKNAFTVNNKTKDVPCVFQIWEYTEKPRLENTMLTTKAITFTTPDKATVAVRRVGGRAGQVLEGLDHSLESTLFIKINNPKANIALKLMNIDKYINNTAGVRSISKKEIEHEVEKIIQKI